MRKLTNLQKGDHSLLNGRELEDIIKDYEKELEKLQEEFEQKQKELEEIDSEIKDEEKRLQKIRAKFEEDVDKILLKRYQRVRDSLGTLVVVPVNNGSCGGCGARVPAQRVVEIWQNNRIYTCESCGRILISDEVYNEVMESVK